MSVFFFKQKTAYEVRISDWSSDVCSSDLLVEMLGGAGEGSELDFNAVPPVPVLMVGLQGSGKTTSTAKIALRLQTRDRKKVLMASLDVYRPAAQEQLKILGEQTGVATLPVVAGQMPVDLAKRALQAAKLGGYDVDRKITRLHSSNYCAFRM